MPLPHSLPAGRHALAALAMTLAVAGCASTHGMAPQSAMRDSDRLQAGESLARVDVTPAAWPDARWWQSLGDAQLDALITRALADSPGIEAADARLRKALAQAGLAEAGLLPTLGASAQHTHIDLPDSLLHPLHICPSERSGASFGRWEERRWSCNREEGEARRWFWNGDDGEERRWFCNG